MRAERRTGLGAALRVVWSAVVLVGLLTACASDPAPAVTSPEASPVVTAPAPDVAPAPTAAPTTAPAPPPPSVMAASVPLRLEVPAIAVDSDLMALGLLADGTLEVPPAAFPAGWFTGAPTPGEQGPAVIAGHIDWVTGPGVFYRLAALEVGAEIRVSRADGTVAVFRTTEVSTYPKDAFPTELVYGDIDHAGLRLISCGGAFNSGTGHYEDNVVVFAELVT